MNNQQLNPQQALQEQAAPSKNFLAAVVREGARSLVNADSFSEREKQLIVGYYLKADKALADQNLNWGQVVDQNIMMIDLIHLAKLGVDANEPAALYFIPRKKGNALRDPNGDAWQPYTLTPQLGYNGLGYIAKKYAVIPPDDIKLELVYSTDKFTCGKAAGGDTYNLAITNPFERGELIGAFGFVEYTEQKRNRLLVMSRSELDKRRNASMSDKFWGKWTPEMYLKTIARKVYNSIPRDTHKIDATYNRVNEISVREVEYEVINEIADNANRIPIDVTATAENDSEQPPTMQDEYMPQSQAAESDGDLPF